MIRFFNTLGKKVQPFKPLKSGQVGIYSCGPTVYNYAHLGNFRAFVFFDLLKRYLKYSGFRVKHVMNITDVDDKTIKGSQEKGWSLRKYTNFYLRAFLKDIKSLNILTPEVMPKATEHIPEMVALIKKLLQKGYAYCSEGSVYYKISRFKNYGQLANLDKQSLKFNADGRLNARDEYGKEEISDFALWKGWDRDDGRVFWKTALGKGRPGWHIECSAMSMKYLGKTFDIHCGGIDLVFPHHTNEIAQSEAATGKKFVNYWLHNAYLMVEGKKMSKSLGNFYTLRDIVSKGYHPLLVRIVLLKTHYRQVLDFRTSSLQEAKEIVEKFVNLLVNLDYAPKGRVKNSALRVDFLINSARKKFKKALDNDLNISEAFSALFWFLTETNKLKEKIGLNQAKKIKSFIFEIDQVFGFIKPFYERYLSLLEKKLSGGKIKKLLKEREEARQKKDFARADLLRKKITDAGILVEDERSGCLLKVGKDFF